LKDGVKRLWTERMGGREGGREGGRTYGKHQPLQWNMGTTWRKTVCRGMPVPQLTMFARLFK
jgi:hypothetical protein